MMMTTKKLLTSFLICALAFPLAQSRNLILTHDNHVSLIGMIDGASVAEAQQQLGRVANQALENNQTEVILYISSNGGNVISGNALIEDIHFYQDQGLNITAVAPRAISMAFATLQACDKRCVLPTSILMQHQMSAGGGGEMENLHSHMDFLDQLYDNLLENQAQRLNMTIDDFKKRINHDWWMLGKRAIDNQAADQIVRVGCSPDLYKGNHTEDFYTLFGAFRLTFSDCPLVTFPLHIEPLFSNYTLPNNWREIFSKKSLPSSLDVDYSYSGTCPFDFKQNEKCSSYQGEQTPA